MKFSLITFILSFTTFGLVLANPICNNQPQDTQQNSQSPSMENHATPAAAGSNENLAEYVLIRAAAVDAKNDLSTLKNATLAWAAYRCPIFRRTYNFRATHNGTGQNDQETQVMDTWVRFKGYATFLRTARTCNDSLRIYGNQIRGLLYLSERNINFILNHLDNLPPGLAQLTNLNIPKTYGQRALEHITGVRRYAQQTVRCFTILALTDMINTFNHFEVTDSGVYLDNE